jgi:putative ABC transport system permease protein
VEHVRRIPGVLHAAMISGGIPLRGGISMTSIPAPGGVIELTLRQVTADYHHALRIPLRQGRFFSATDRKGAPAVVIINEVAAKKYFAGESPIGRTLPLDGVPTIVGVVGDVRQVSLEAASIAEAYVPMAQARVSVGELVIRTSGNPYDTLPLVKAAVSSVLPDVPLRNVRTMEELIARQVAQRRLSMLLLGLFGLLGLVIAAVGIYGVMAYVVSQRTREIGVRMALGATRASVVRMVLLNAALLVAMGVVLGGFASWYVSAASTAFLFGLQPTDPRAFAAAAVALSAAAVIASVIPARRAASVDPMVALRTE